MSQRYTVARLTHEGERFEILVKPDAALAYRLGKTTSLSEALVSDTVFTD
ncbi:MAG: SBDS family protein, partial [Candidatus Bathyarchaeia archaeon]